MSRIGKYFLQGLLYTVPISVTVFVIWEIVASVDEQVQPLIPFETWGLGIILVFVIITLIGLVGSMLVTLLPFVSYFERIFVKAPLIKVIYTSVKDLLSSFVGQKKSFEEVVLIKLHPESEVYRIGFLTDASLGKFSLGEDLVSVYVPHSYAISGQLFIVSKNNIKMLDANPTAVMKYIVSGGVTEVEGDEKLDFKRSRSKRKKSQNSQELDSQE